MSEWAMKKGRSVDRVERVWLFVIVLENEPRVSMANMGAPHSEKCTSDQREGG